jgi:hypothetical protein
LEIDAVIDLIEKMSKPPHPKSRWGVAILGTAIIGFAIYVK